MALANQKALRFHHESIGTGRILLGLLWDSDAIPAQVLMNAGLKLKDLRQEVLKLQAAGIG
jgi:ATP-dependent Clp protease ATP-binding subunit ClpA